MGLAATQGTAGPRRRPRSPPGSTIRTPASQDGSTPNSPRAGCGCSYSAASQPWWRCAGPALCPAGACWRSRIVRRGRGLVSVPVGLRLARSRHSTDRSRFPGTRPCWRTTLTVVRLWWNRTSPRLRRDGPERRGVAVAQPWRGSRSAGVVAVPLDGQQETEVVRGETAPARRAASRHTSRCVARTGQLAPRGRCVGSSSGQLGSGAPRGLA